MCNMKLFLKRGLWLALAIASSSVMVNAQEVAVGQLTQAATPSLNIRYIDSDYILANYTMAVEYQKWVTATTDSVKGVLEQKYKEAKDFEAKCQKKLQNNQYKSDQAVRNDQKKLQKMVEDVQALETKLNKEMNEENARRSQELQDSIMSYINEYNAIHKYDAILYKSAGVLFNPSLDITDEILAGLNARYNKPEEVVLPPTGEEPVPVKAEDNTVTP